MAIDLSDLRKMSNLDEAGCWIWTRGKAGAGYGMIYQPGAGRSLYAHRVAADLAHGPCPEGKEVMHSCDVRACINPDHLSYGTRAENVRDMFAKGRNRLNPRRGESHGMAKLTEAQVLDMRNQREAGASLSTLAKAFGVTPPGVHLIVTRKKWAHV